MSVTFQWPVPELHTFTRAEACTSLTRLHPSILTPCGSVRVLDPLSHQTPCYVRPPKLHVGVASLLASCCAISVEPSFTERVGKTPQVAHLCLSACTPWKHALYYRAGSPDQNWLHIPKASKNVFLLSASSWR